MADAFDAIVVGAGPAGAGVAIHLSSHGHSVLLLEKHVYPVHKLCGEFLSGESQSYLLRLGVLEAVNTSGARHIDRALLTSEDGSAVTLNLPSTGLGVSRFALDHMLLVRAVAAGVEVRQGLTVKEINGNLDLGFVVITDTGSFRARMVVGAFGKRSTLDRKLGRDFLSATRDAVAFKAHYAGRPVDDLVELHAYSGGYCGLCPVGDAVVNVCWIGSEEMLRACGGDPEAMLTRMKASNRELAHSLGGLTRVPSSYLAVSQLFFKSKGVFAGDVCLVGDAAGLIAPMCGDGMSMAFRSAELLVTHADRYLRGRIDAAGFKRRYARWWKLEFGIRMRMGRFLHDGFVKPRRARAGLRIVRAIPPVGTALLRLTRG